MDAAATKGTALGNLCKRGHDHEGTGKSLRYVSSGACVICNRKSAKASKPAKVAKPTTKRGTKRKTKAPPAPRAATPPRIDRHPTVWPGFAEHVGSFVDALRAGADALLAADDPRWQVLTGLAAVLETGAKRGAK